MYHIRLRRSGVEGRYLAQSCFVEAHDPAVVWLFVLMSSPAHVNNIAHERESGALVMRLWIESNLTPGSVGRGPGQERGNRNRPARHFVAGRYGDGVKALEEGGTRGGVRLADHVKRGRVRRRIDHRCPGDADRGCDIAAATADE